MAIPIYHLWLVRRFGEAYNQLTDAERDAWWASLRANAKAPKAEYVVTCQSRWSHETYPAWGLDVYPDLAARIRAARENEASQSCRYMEVETLLATKMEQVPTSPVEFPNPIYQLALMRRVQNQPWESMSREEPGRFWARMMESIQKLGGALVIACDTDWSTEEYSGFGITAWPSREAARANTDGMAEIGWHHHIYAKTILGTKIG